MLPRYVLIGTYVYLLPLIVEIGAAVHVIKIIYGELRCAPVWSAICRRNIGYRADLQTPHTRGIGFFAVFSANCITDKIGDNFQGSAILAVVSE
jgi:hypothetical protein